MDAANSECGHLWTSLDIVYVVDTCVGGEKQFMSLSKC